MNVLPLARVKAAVCMGTLLMNLTAQAFPATCIPANLEGDSHTCSAVAYGVSTAVLWNSPELFGILPWDMPMFNQLDDSKGCCVYMALQAAASSMCPMQGIAAAHSLRHMQGLEPCLAVLCVCCMPVRVYFLCLLLVMGAVSLSSAILLLHIAANRIHVGVWPAKHTCCVAMHTDIHVVTCVAYKSTVHGV